MILKPFVEFTGIWKTIFKKKKTEKFRNKKFETILIISRYGQRKQCFVYRLVMDSCLEKKIYDRQVNKQGMADRVVDELNPDAHLSIKEVKRRIFFFVIISRV